MVSERMSVSYTSNKYGSPVLLLLIPTSVSVNVIHGQDLPFSVGRILVDGLWHPCIIVVITVSSTGPVTGEIRTFFCICIIIKICLPLKFQLSSVPLLFYEFNNWMTLIFTKGFISTTSWDGSSRHTSFVPSTLASGVSTISTGRPPLC